MAEREENTREIFRVRKICKGYICEKSVCSVKGNQNAVALCFVCVWVTLRSSGYQKILPPPPPIEGCYLPKSLTLWVFGCFFQLEWPQKPFKLVLRARIHWERKRRSRKRSMIWLMMTSRQVSINIWSVFFFHILGAVQRRWSIFCQIAYFSRENEIVKLLYEEVCAIRNEVIWKSKRAVDKD